MSVDPFPLFLELVTFDRGIRELHTARARHQAQFDDAQQSIETLSLDLARFKRVFLDAQKSVDELELIMKDLDEAEKTKKSQLECAASTKEVSGLKKEISSLKQEQHDNESELIARWNRLETVTKEFEDKKQKIEAQIAELQQHVDTLEQEIQTVENSLNEKEATRAGKVHVVPEELLEKYNAMRLRVDNPVVPIENDACSACFHHITRQEMFDVERKRLLQCTGCFRFLYIAMASKETTVEASDTHE